MKLMGQCNFWQQQCLGLRIGVGDFFTNPGFSPSAVLGTHVHSALTGICLGHWDLIDTALVFVAWARALPLALHAF